LFDRQGRRITDRRRRQRYCRLQVVCRFPSSFSATSG
jgi:hypothetical protein